MRSAAWLQSDAMDPREGEVAPAAGARARGLPLSIAPLTTGLDMADAFEIDRGLRLALRLELPEHPAR
jgi:hypothetical protein